MFMGMGMFEIVIIAGVALVVVGPEKFPPFAKAVFKTIRDLRTQIEQTQREITKEMQPIQKEMRELRKHKPEDYIDGLTAGTKSSGDSDFDYNYPYDDYESTTKDKKEAESADVKSDAAAPPDGTETFDAVDTADSPPEENVEEDISLEPDGPDWDRYDAEQRAASGDGTD